MSSNPDIPDKLYYLDDDFSVRSLRKYQLKEILSTHNIPYFQGITRPDLIKLFKKNIEARRDEILSEYKAATLAEKQAEITQELGRGHRASHKPTKFTDVSVNVPKRRRPHTDEERISSVKKDKDGYAIPAIPANRRKTVPAFNPEDSFDEDDNYFIAASPHHVAPQIHAQKVATSTSKLTSEAKKPRVPAAPVRKSARRTKLDPPKFNPEDSFASSDEEGYSTTKREARPESPKNKSENGKVTFGKETAEDEDNGDSDYQVDGDVSDDEDDELGQVDKEELVQLYKDQAIPVEKFVAPEYTISTRSQTMTTAKENVLLWKAKFRQIGCVLCGVYMFFALICLGITAYARQKNGYCQNYPDIITEKPVSSSFFSLFPSPCIPCPDHGICAGGELTCDTLYERKTPLYNIGHMFPIADDCIHNSVLGKYVARVERKIKHKLAVRQGESACKYFLAHADIEDTEPAPIVRVLVKDILSDLKQNIQPALPADKTDEIMIIALATVLEDPKIRYWEVDGDRYLGTEYFHYSTKCQLQRLYKKTPFNVKMMIVTFLSVVSAFIGASRDYKKSKIYKHKIDVLVKDTTERLMKQYENHLKDPIQYPSAAISVSQIRSSLVDVNDSKTIKDWHSVVEKIESHPHIRKSFQEVRGDPVEYWELTV
ncbi:Man1-Src1p-C-terminal domain-containing protein [Parasitella parasitica]|nr:Man1-Src1p-C-terminal domain-containing protein [Parasitella parasitica]